MSAASATTLFILFISYCTLATSAPLHVSASLTGPEPTHRIVQILDLSTRKFLSVTEDGIVRANGNIGSSNVCFRQLQYPEPGVYQFETLQNPPQVLQVTDDGEIFAREKLIEGDSGSGEEIAYSKFDVQHFNIPISIYVHEKPSCSLAFNATTHEPLNACNHSPARFIVTISQFCRRFQ